MIKLFLLNLVLGFLWMCLWGSFDIYTLGAGLGIGYLLIGLAGRSMFDDARYLHKLVKLVRFTIYFIRILVESNLIVAHEIMTPGIGISPAIIRYPVEGMTPLQITTLANAISLTPGTLSMDVSEDQKVLYIHAMYWKDRKEALRGLDELKHRIMDEVFG